MCEVKILTTTQIKCTVPQPLVCIVKSLFWGIGIRCICNIRTRIKMFLRSQMDILMLTRQSMKQTHTVYVQKNRPLN